jgi:acyl-homoserine-lactone acylase
MTTNQRPAASVTPGTEILWDEYGIPHIFAPDHPSLFFAYGYAQMEAHAELLVRLYAQARGTAAEFYGVAYLDDDRWVRINGIPERAGVWSGQQSPEFAHMLAAFAAGLNGWVNDHPDGLSSAARALLPLTVADVLGHGMRVINLEWQASRAKVEQRLGGLFEPPKGSNGWAIGPTRSASGNAMLLSNSHLPWGDRDTYFEVQLTAPGVTSYGAVWVGFPVLRQCFTEYLGWTQTTNNPNTTTLYRLECRGPDSYVLDDETQAFQVEDQTVKVRQSDGVVRAEKLTIRRSVHGPVVAARDGVTAALRVAGWDRPRMFEQFWRMGLARDLEQFHEAMRMQQLPFFNTMYADRDGHIMYLYNAASPRRSEGDHSYWQTAVPGDRSDLIWSDEIVPYDELPKVIDPPNGWVQNCNDSPWTCTFPMALRPSEFPAYLAPPPGLNPRAQRSIRMLGESHDISLSELKSMKLSTRVESADHFVGDLLAAARQSGGEREERAAKLLDAWDRRTDNDSDGAFLFYCFLQAAGGDFATIGGYAVPADPAQPLTTPRGFAAPAQAAALLNVVAERLESEYGTLHVPWGDVVRFRVGSLDLPANGAPGEMGAVRTAIPGPFENGKAKIQAGDTFYAVVEFSDPVQGEALLAYGNWSREGSSHRQDQLALASRNEMRPILRRRDQIEAVLENRKLF